MNTMTTQALQDTSDNLEEHEADPQEAGPIERAHDASERVVRLHGYVGHVREVMFEIGQDLTWMKKKFAPVDQPEWLQLAGLNVMPAKERDLAIWWFYNREAVEKAPGFLGPRMASIKGIQTAFAKWRKTHEPESGAIEMKGELPENPFDVYDVQRHHSDEIRSIRSNVAAMSKTAVLGAHACPENQRAYREQMFTITTLEAALREEYEALRREINFDQPDERTMVPRTKLWKVKGRRKRAP